MLIALHLFAPHLRATPVATQTTALSAILRLCQVFLYYFTGFQISPFSEILSQCPIFKTEKEKLPKSLWAIFTMAALSHLKFLQWRWELFTVLTGPWRAFIMCSKPDSSKIMEPKLHLFNQHELFACLLCARYNSWHLEYISEQTGRIPCRWWSLYSVPVDLKAGLSNSKIVWTSWDTTVALLGFFGFLSCSINLSPLTWATVV